MEGHMRADLHLHTIASDGRWGPEQLIKELRGVGVGLFSVTDHDSLGSLAETAVRVQDSGLRFLPGVELSARLDGQLYHLLGYGFDPTEPQLNRFVEANGAMLQGASDDAVRLLAEAGYPVSLDDYTAFTWDRHRGGWKALNYLIDRGLCQDIRGYFDVLFAGELVHPQPEFPPPEEVIAVVGQARGLVSLAHPGALFYNGVDERLLDRLVEMLKETVGTRDPVNVAVVHARALEEGRDLLERLKATFDCREAMFAELVASLAVHGGPGIVGVFAYKC